MYVIAKLRFLGVTNGKIWNEEGVINYIWSKKVGWMVCIRLLSECGEVSKCLMKE